MIWRKEKRERRRWLYVLWVMWFTALSFIVSIPFDCGYLIALKLEHFYRHQFSALKLWSWRSAWRSNTLLRSKNCSIQIWATWHISPKNNISLSARSPISTIKDTEHTTISKYIITTDPFVNHIKLHQNWHILVLSHPNISLTKGC